MKCMGLPSSNFIVSEFFSVVLKNILIIVVSKNNASLVEFKIKVFDNLFSLISESSNVMKVYVILYYN